MQARDVVGHQWVLVLPVGNAVLVERHKEVPGMVEVIAQRRQQLKQQMDALSQAGRMDDVVGAVLRLRLTDSTKRGLQNHNH